MRSTTDFLIELLRLRTYRGLDPARFGNLAAEELAAGNDDPVVMELATLMQPGTAGDSALASALAQVGLVDAGPIARAREIRFTCSEIADGTIDPLDGGVALSRLFYEDETNAVLLEFWRAMNAPDDLDARPQLADEIKKLALDYLASNG